MPIMDGHEATRQIRKLEGLENKLKRTPIVAVTTVDATDANKLKAQEAGMNDFQDKSFNIDEMINRHLGSAAPSADGKDSPRSPETPMSSLLSTLGITSTITREIEGSSRSFSCGSNHA